LKLFHQEIVYRFTAKSVKDKNTLKTRSTWGPKTADKAADSVIKTTLSCSGRKSAKEFLDRIQIVLRISAKIETLLLRLPTPSKYFKRIQR